MASLHILLIDDEPAVRQILASVVRHAGYSVVETGLAAEAAAKLAQGDVDVALCDIKMRDGNGIDLIRDSRSAGIDTTFIMMTAFDSVEMAVDALRAGAFDYIFKPVNSEELLHRLSQTDALRSLREENRALRRVVSEQSRSYGCTSLCMLEIERLIAKVSPYGNGRQTAGVSIANGQGLRDQLRKVEAEIVRRAIADAEGDRRSAAQRLGIGLSSLYRKLEEFERLGLWPVPEPFAQEVSGD